MAFGSFSFRIPLRSVLAALTCAWLGVVAAPTSADAQGITLTPEQRRMLDQLPPSQRQAILDQVNQQRRAQQPTELESPDVVVRTNGEGMETPIDEPEAEEVRLEAGDTVVVTLGNGHGEAINGGEESDPLAELSPTAQEEAVELRLRILAANPYVLDELGRIQMPGIGSVGLAGLNEEEAGIRLGAEERLQLWDVGVRRLPLREMGARALEPFGYDLFEGAPTTFAPVTEIPVPSDYVVGPGDTLRLQLFGNQNGDFELLVNRDGVINLPEIGPLPVAGLSFRELREEIGRQISEQMIGTRVSVTLGELRSIRVFVMGDVNRPGAYQVSALSTISNALFVSGGIDERGSLRDVQLKRNGQTVARLDLYDLLLRGDTSDDVRVQPGDVIFVPPVGKRISIAGDVKRPAVYEFQTAIDAGDALSIAGGALSSAYLGGARVERLVPGEGISVYELDLSTATGRDFVLADGDILVLPTGVAQLERVVTLRGHVQRPGQYQWRPGLRLTSILPSSRAVKPGTDLNYVLVRREVVPNGRIEVLSADLEAAWAAEGSVLDLELRARDDVYVFSLEEDRSYVVEPILEDLERQAGADRPVAAVRVGGQVKSEGRYPLEPGMRIGDLVRAGGGLSDAAYQQQAELTRYRIVNGEFREVEHVEVDLAAALAGDPSANAVLAPYDYLNVKEIPRWGDQGLVEIVGEVAFPGRYPIQQGETLSSVLQRAGGLTDFAFAGGAIFTRETLKEREREQLDQLAIRIQGDLASLSLQDPNQAEALTIGQSILSQIRTAEPTGRLVIDLRAIAAGRQSADVVLRDGDTLMVPQMSQEVTVIGEVQYATSHLHQEGLARDDYISRSGGLTAKADEARIYVVRASGEVIATNRSRFFSKSVGLDMQPGDTVVVPLDTDRVKPLVLWTSATQILYNLAIAAAAVNSF